MSENNVDMDEHDWELSKENILPLKKGRNVKKIREILRNKPEEIETKQK